MSTNQQKEAAKVYLETIGSKEQKTKGEILKDAGYPESIQKNPQYVFESEGFKNAIKEMSEHLMIDKQSRLFRLAQILWDKDKRASLAANDQITKIFGEYSPIKQEIDDVRDKRMDIVKPM